DLADLFAHVEKARRQLDPVPGLIENRKWDAIRRTPSARAMPNGDELAALEAREEAVTHLQFLDMAAYVLSCHPPAPFNNNFSPAGGEKEVAASKELIKQYDELPRDVLKATSP
ncbi:hypothetical protein M885DRAFT_501640, partial [Pelagophyceae sp. CCMP2097]